MRVFLLSCILVVSPGCEKVKSFFSSFISSKQQESKPTEVPSYKDIQIQNVIKIDIGQGQGAELQEGQTASIYWDCWIYDPAAPGNKGKLIYSSDPKSKPHIITVGKNEIAPGVDIGIVGMKPSGKRQLIVPTELAYGEKGSGSVPGGAIVLFEITLVSISE